MWGTWGNQLEWDSSVLRPQDYVPKAHRRADGMLVVNINRYIQVSKTHSFSDGVLYQMCVFFSLVFPMALLGRLQLWLEVSSGRLTGPRAHHERLFLERLRNAPENVKSFIEERKEHIDESGLAISDAEPFFVGRVSACISQNLQYSAIICY